MYSTRVPEISDEPVQFGTSGLLYHSNKVMYDRVTFSLWRQFTGEPVVGPLADSGIKLKIFPSTLTTWSAWLAMHPDTTVLSNETGVYGPESYLPESDPNSLYFSVRNASGIGFPAWPQNDTLPKKTIVLGVNVGGLTKAYALDDLAAEPVLNDTVGGTNLVVVTDPQQSGPRVYLSEGVRFESLPAVQGGEITVTGAGREVWRVTEEALVRVDDPSRVLERLPTIISYWFGWYISHPGTMVHGHEPPA